MNFLPHRAGDAPLLVQVCLESEGDETWERELRALEAAAHTASLGDGSLTPAAGQEVKETEETAEFNRTISFAAFA